MQAFLGELVFRPSLQMPAQPRTTFPPPGGGALPYMGYMGMYRCEGYAFQAVYSRIGYIKQSVWV